MANLIDVEIKMKRTINKQKHRANHKFDDQNQSLENYFRVSIFLPYIEYFISQLEVRFLVHKKIFEGELYIFFGIILEN